MSGRPPPQGRSTSVLLGVLRVARGREDGLDQFGNTPQAFLASLAPLIAFPLVGGILMLSGGAGLAALSETLATFCALLAPPVLSAALARLWKREELWLHFATAFNWCQWAIPVLALILVLPLRLLIRMGLPSQTGGALAIAGIACYGLWLHWFIVRHGLKLSAMRAAFFVLIVNVCTGLIIVAPRAVAVALGSAAGSGH